MNIPDNWIVFRINKPGDEHYRLLCGWSGGYTYGDSWKINSGITRVEEKKDAYHFYGESGSVYVCRKGGYGLRMNNVHIWNHYSKTNDVEMLPEDTNWKEFDWSE